MTRNTGLDNWLGAARDDAARRMPDSLVEQQLLARVRERGALHGVAVARQPTAPPAAGIAWWRRWSVGVPVALAAGLALLLIATPMTPVAPPAAAAATPFFALAGIDAIAAETAPVVVASRVPRTALADYGLPVDPARADEPVNAEFLMSRAGVVLAVRFRE
jgi:hypothetical protein